MSSFTLAAEYVTDTVGLILHLEKRKLSASAEQIFDSAENGQTIIHIPAMVFAEILYLSEKKRITANLTDVSTLLQNFPNFKEFPLTADVIKSAEQITDIPELHDRIISAAAKLMNLELITNDTKIQSSTFVKTIW
jgi:predicted nucleic acid-binding protein